MKKALMGADALALGTLLAAPLSPALAHDDDDYNNHARAHEEHGDYHEDQAEAHARAHQEGFESRWEHRAYHRALREQHEEFHEDHPNTWHDHYYRPHRRWSYWYWGY